MATKVTTKTPLFGNKRSHALNATKMQQNPNMQTFTIDGKKVRMCARDARTMKKADKITEKVEKNTEEETTEKAA